MTHRSPWPGLAAAMTFALSLGCRSVTPPPAAAAPAPQVESARPAAAATTTVPLPSGRVGAARCAGDGPCLLLGPMSVGKGADKKQAAQVDATLAATLQAIVDGRVERLEDARRRAAQKLPTPEQCGKGDCLEALARAGGFSYVARPELVLTEAGPGLTIYFVDATDPKRVGGGLILGGAGSLADGAWLRPHLWAHSAGIRGLPIRHDPSLPPPAPMEWIASGPAGVSFARTETTLAQFRACVEAGACVAGQKGEDCNWERSDREGHPVNCASAEDAMAFCAWVGGRLPTDAEWFAEASDSGKRRFPWGDAPAKGAEAAPMDCAHAVWRGEEGPRGCGRESTAPVCSMPAGNSVSGVCDLSGNVWELTSSDGTAQHTEHRGGSWMERSPFPTTSAAAEPPRRFLSWGEMGFRCVRAP